MENALVTLATIELPAPAEGQPVPEWVHLLPKGEVRARDGRGPWHYDDARGVIAESFSRRRRVHVDENHSTDTAAKLGMSAPARGFITEMEERADGIWGKVDWTESGRALLSDRAYWGISPVLSYDKTTGRVSAIARAALTNDPALSELLALNTTQETTMFRTKMATLLGLSAEASEAEIETALSTRIEAGAEEGDTEALSAIGTALGLEEGEVTLTGILAAAQVLKAGSAEAADTLASLQAKVGQLESDGKKKAAEDFVDQAIRDKRSGAKASRDELVALHMENPERARKIVEAMPRLGEVTLTAQPVLKEGEVALQSEHQAAARALGIDPKAYAETLKSERNEETL